MLTINPKNAHQQIALIFVGALLCLLTIMTPDAEAQKPPQETQPTGMQIIGHSDLDGVRGLKIFLQEQQGRWYLYAGHASERGLTIVEVTDPAHPKVVKSVASSKVPGSLGAVEQVGDLTFATTRGGPADDGVDPLNTVPGGLTIWDLTDPVNPQVVREFSGVSDVLMDARGCVYVIDRDGLWILRKAEPPVTFPYGPEDPYPNGQDLYHG